MKPTEVPILYRRLKRNTKYQFVLDAANVVVTTIYEVVNRDASEPWPLMLRPDRGGDYILVTEDECRNIRAVCPDCGSVMFDVQPDKSPTCVDCGRILPREEIEQA